MPRPMQHHIQAYLRLLVALGAGGVASALLANSFDLATRLLFGWNIGVCVLLALTWYLFATADEAQLRKRAAGEDEPRTVILAVMVAAVLASLGGTVIEVQVAKAATGFPAATATALCISTVVLSWLCMHTLFAVHYAHEFYGERGRKGVSAGGLEFPHSPPSIGYTEFVYMAFCVGMTYQVSDMSALNRKFRWLITVHAGLSFFFNTFILALIVNFISGLGRPG